MIAERLRWAVELLDVRPADRILEIGCGTGIAAALMAERLTSGRVTAVDRSEAMIRQARSRHAELVAAGRTEFLHVALGAAEFPGERFDKLFAVNVNVFWQRPERELAIVASLLKPQGTLLLVYEPPTPGKAQAIADRVRAHLEGSGFTITDEHFRPIGPAIAVALLARHTSRRMVSTA